MQFHVNEVHERHLYCRRQEAQLSQRGRATLRVIKYFAKSLEVIRNDTLK